MYALSGQNRWLLRPQPEFLYWLPKAINLALLPTTVASLSPNVCAEHGDKDSFDLQRASIRLPVLIARKFQPAASTNIDKLTTIDPVQVGENQLSDYEGFPDDFATLPVANELDGEPTEGRAVVLHSLVGTPQQDFIKKWNLSNPVKEDCTQLLVAINSNRKPDEKMSFAMFRFHFRI